MNLLLILAFSTVISTLSLAILACIFYYLKLHEKHDELIKQNLYLKQHISEKGLEKINVAREKASKIITDASIQADEILKKAETLKSDTGKQLADELIELTRKQKDELTKAAENLRTSFLDVISHLQEEDINILENVTKDIENAAINEVQKFEKQLHDATIGQQEVIDQKIQDAFAKANFDIEEYKKTKAGEADKKLHALLQSAAKEVIGKSLSYEDHKDIIMSALEDVKAQMGEGS